MEKIDLQTLKNIQTDILVDIDKFCRNNKITYFLAYGSLIGAIRHKGFIPWDDDIDIAMPRPDFERFLSIYKAEHYRVLSLRQKKNFPFPYAKVEDVRTFIDEHQSYNFKMGINVDIFPIDGLPNDKNTIKKHIDKIKFFRMLRRVKQIRLSSKRSILKNAIHLAGKIALYPIEIMWITRKIDKLERKFEYGTTGFAGDLNSGGYEQCMPISTFNGVVETDFEGHLIFVPKGYDSWLRSQFGDYMQLPPVEKRVSMHNADAYILDTE